MIITETEIGDSRQAARAASSITRFPASMVAECSRRSPQQRVHAGEQFGQGERFHQVVICADGEPGQPVI